MALLALLYQRLQLVVATRDGFKAFVKESHLAEHTFRAVHLVHNSFWIYHIQYRIAEDFLNLAVFNAFLDKLYIHGSVLHTCDLLDNVLELGYLSLGLDQGFQELVDLRLKLL